jgi:chromosome segregation ATPase
VARQFGVQYVPRTWGLAEYTGSFKEASSLDKLDAIRNDWKQPILVHKEELQKEFSISPNYSIWRSGNSLKILQEATELGVTRDKSSVTLELKSKRVNNEEDLQKELDKLRIELSKSKNHQKFLENQLLKEEEMKASLDQQLKEKDEQIVKLRKNQQEANEQLKEGKAKYDELVNKHVMVEQELVTLKRASESRKSANKETIASLKKERDQYKLKWEAEKEKNGLADLTIEEERSLRTRYQMQAEDEREARRVAESDMKGYLDKINGMRNRVSVIQAELESREEEAKKMQEQFEEWQDYIISLDVQLNTKVAELDIEKEELQRARKQIQQLEKMVQILETNNESLAASNGTLLQDNTLFHYKIEQTDRLIDMVARKANELRVKASRIGNSRHRYEEYLNEVYSFIRNVANRGITFE